MSAGMIRADAASIPGLGMLPLPRFEDARGFFVKTYSSRMLGALGLDCRWHEAYYTWSHPGVVRGMHFQVPPHDHAKCVVCISGRILDVVVDLRRGSPTEGRSIEVEMDGASPMAVLIPSGCAHGFAVLGDTPALVGYLTGSVHQPDADKGILWSSVAASWPRGNLVVSERDASFPRLIDFASPFTYPPC